jgi:Acylamino-acid-releasing enzyme, N-terminal domain
MLENENAKDTFRSIAIPRYSGVINISESEDIVLITANVSAYDFARAKKVKLISDIVYTPNQPLKKFPLQSADSTCGLVSVSPSGRYARLRTIDEKRFVEITGASFESYDVTKTHGDFFNDDYFGTISWSADESSIVYAASSHVKEDNSKFTPRSDAGEGYTSKSPAKIALLDFSDNSYVKSSLLDLDFHGVSQVLKPNVALLFPRCFFHLLYRRRVKACSAWTQVLYKQELSTIFCSS